MATTIPTKIIKIKNNPSREVGASATDRKNRAKQSKVSFSQLQKKENKKPLEQSNRSAKELLI